MGCCENCCKGGALDTVQVTEVGKSAPIVQLRLCARCAEVPSAVWRRRYQPLAVQAGNYSS